MSLWTQVDLTDNGPISEDDGQSAWHSTTVRFGWGHIGVIADVRIDGYTGKAIAHINYDGIGLPVDLLEQLVVRLRRVCGWNMRATHSDTDSVPCDVENIARTIFYHGEAQKIVRKLRSAAPSRLSVIAPPTPKGMS